METTRKCLTVAELKALRYWHAFDSGKRIWRVFDREEGEWLGDYGQGSKGARAAAEAAREMNDDCTK